MYGIFATHPRTKTGQIALSLSHVRTLHEEFAEGDLVHRTIVVNSQPATCVSARLCAGAHIYTTTLLYT
jgi:hypothetical protein